MKINKKSFFKELRSWIFTIFIALAIYLVITQFVQIGKINGSSMESTYFDGNLIIINKFN